MGVKSFCSIKMITVEKINSIINKLDPSPHICYTLMCYKFFNVCIVQIIIIKKILSNIFSIYIHDNLALTSLNGLSNRKTDKRFKITS